MKLRSIFLLTVLLTTGSLTAYSNSKMKVVLGSVSQVLGPKEGELAFDASVSGPVLYHKGSWRSFTPIARTSLPDLKISASQITLFSNGGITLGNGETHVMKEPISIAISSLSSVAPGWNALFAYSVSGQLFLTRSGNFEQPDDSALSDVVLNQRYRYVGSFFMKSTSPMSAMPLLRKGGIYSYSMILTPPASSPGTVASWSFSGTPPLAQVLRFSGAFDNAVYDSYGIILAITTTTSQFESLNIQGNFQVIGNPSQFVIGYAGTLSNTKFVGHLEDPILFVN